MWMTLTECAEHEHVERTHTLHYGIYFEYKKKNDKNVTFCFPVQKISFFFPQMRESLKSIICNVVKIIMSTTLTIIST